MGQSAPFVYLRNRRGEDCEACAVGEEIYRRGLGGEDGSMRIGEERGLDAVLAEANGEVLSVSGVCRKLKNQEVQGQWWVRGMPRVPALMRIPPQSHTDIQPDDKKN